MISALQTHSDIIEQFRAAMHERDINVIGEIIADGKLHRYRVDGDKKGQRNAWAVLHLDGNKPAGAFGCCRRYGTDQKFTWSGKATKPLTAAERRELRKRMERQKAERAEAERARHAAAAAEAERIWDAAEECTEHPYLTRKQIQSHGLRVGVWEKVHPETGEVRLISKRALLVPIRDAKKRIHSLQAIFPSKLLGDRDKDYLTDGAKEGLFYSFGTPQKLDGKLVIIICEGYATGASLHEATGHAVIVAFDAGNLLPVARVIRARFPDALIVMAADNDRWTVKPINNPGVTRAREAAEAIGGMVAVPDFTNFAGNPTDFNDLCASEGARAVKAIIDDTLDEATRVLPLWLVPKCGSAELDQIQFAVDGLATFDSELAGRLSRRGAVLVEYNGSGDLCAALESAAQFMPNAVVQVLADPKQERETVQIAQENGVSVRLPQAGVSWATAIWADLCAVTGSQTLRWMAAQTDAADDEKAAGAVARASAGQHATTADSLESGFTVLGGARDAKTIYIFSHSSRQIMDLRAGSIREGDLLALLPDVNWWELEFPKKGGIDVKQAISFLVQRAHARGVFNPDVKRGRGGWTDAGRTVLHLGDRLIVDGVETALTKIKSKSIYPANFALPSPSAIPLSDDEARRILQIAGRFRWKRPASAALLSGWIALAPLCGALRWRPHVWVTGGTGSGKTSLMTQFVHELVNGGPDGHAGWAQFLNGNSTDAGVRQDLQDDALPVLFDEFEGAEEQDARRVQNMLALARQASSNTAARTVKGTPGGQAMAFRTRSMFAFSSVGVSLKQQADVERISVLDLRPKRDGFEAGAWERIVEELATLRRDGYAGRLLRRSINLLPVTLKNIQTFAAVAANRFGSQRDGDQYGTLLAGAWSLHSSAEVTAEQARHWIGSFEWADFIDEGEGRASVIDAMFGKAVRLNSGEQVLFGALVRRADHRDVEGVQVTPETASAALALYGVRVSSGWMYVSNKGTASRAELLKGTHFASPDTLRRSLREMPGADNSGNKAVHFPGIGTDKCSRVPLKSILVDGEDQAEVNGEQF
ncbi:toprim domain-containing protein [Cupriavidus sp. UYPR2.512]|uniref:toprim domain-containing protein n=1 Tax=Cupriavidus sp. UYPR2.512 TaxID=1080187 RepID=UPI00036B4D11|nr:toprim domain-containing protein [Cupriavidus sp. UYPR2.512]UIF85156.1 toprim domain-containing protein [Cupriavidus necator]